MSERPVVRLEKVVKRFAGSQETILNIPRLELQAGQQLALKGKSGSGKSTLLNLIAGLLVADSGLVEVDGRDMGQLSESGRDQWRGRRIGYVHQTFQLLPGLTVAENLWLAAALSGCSNLNRIETFLERLELQGRRDHRPSQLSQGQQQRVAVARALLHEPAVVLADEPTGNLDAELARAALGLLREMCLESGAALLVVSHDQSVYEAFENRLDLAEIHQPCS